MIFIIFNVQYNHNIIQRKNVNFVVNYEDSQFFPQGEEVEDFWPAAEAQLTLVEATEMVERVVKDSFRVEREVEHWETMPMGGLVGEEERTEMEEVLEAEAATQGALVGTIS